MPYGKYLLVVDGVTTKAAASAEYSEPLNVQNFKSIGIYVKEDNTNAIKFTVEAIGAVHSKAGWVEILAVQTVAKDGHLFVGQVTKTLTGYITCELLNESWAAIRIKFYDSVDATHGKVYAWINRRRH